MRATSPFARVPTKHPTRVFTTRQLSWINMSSTPTCLEYLRGNHNPVNLQFRFAGKVACRDDTRFTFAIPQDAFRTLGQCRTHSATDAPQSRGLFRASESGGDQRGGQTRLRWATRRNQGSLPAWDIVPRHEAPAIGFEHRQGVPVWNPTLGAGPCEHEDNEPHNRGGSDNGAHFEHDHDGHPDSRLNLELGHERVNRRPLAVNEARDFRTRSCAEELESAVVLGHPPQRSFPQRIFRRPRPHCILAPQTGM